MARTIGRRTWPTWLLFLGLLGAAAAFETASQRSELAQGYLVSSAGQGNDAALAQAAGEFRIVAANILWSKVIDHYHHQYMADGGDWSKNESLLPLLQTIITLDPHFMQAYQIMGGAILPRTGRAAEGEEILRKGIASNVGDPQEWELYRELAMVFAATEHKPSQALPYAERGLALASDEFSRNLMSKLTASLHRQIAEEEQTPRRKNPS